MSAPAFWITLLAGEVALVVFVLLFISWIRNIGATRRDREAVSRLVKEVRNLKSEREAAVASFLSDEMGLADDVLTDTTATILREELRLIQAFANTYSDRDSRAATSFRLNVEQAVAPYYTLKGSVKPGGSGDDAEIEALRRENARLSEELTVTMDTMSRMLTEYSGMFAGDETGEASPAEKSASKASASAPTVEAPIQAPVEQNREPPNIKRQNDGAETEEAQTEATKVIDPEPAAVREEPVPDVQAQGGPEQGADAEVAHPVKGEEGEESGEPSMDLRHDVTEAVEVEAAGPQTEPVDETARPETEMEAGAGPEPEPEPAAKQPGSHRNEVVDLDLEAQEDVVAEPVDLGEVVELVPEEPAEGEVQDAAVDLMAEPVHDDEIDSLIDAGSLEDELGDLFDSDDIAVLDDLPDETGDDQPEQATIAI